MTPPKVRIYCKGPTANWRRQAMQAADGTWYAGWNKETPKFVHTWHWKWSCEGKHVTHDLIMKPILYGGSRYGYQMCMQNLREHFQRYHSDD